MKKKLLFLFVLVFALALTFTSCFKGNKKIESMEIVQGTLKYEYQLNETPDFSAVQVVVKYNDDSTKTVGASELKFDLDTKSVGKKDLTITYEDFSMSVSVNVVGSSGGTTPAPEEAKVTAIQIDKASVPEAVLKGAALDTSKLVVYATYSDNSVKSIPLSSLTIVNIDTSTAGKKTLTVKYSDTITASVEIEVVDIKSMAIISDTIPSKIMKGAALDTSNAKLSVTYSNNTTEIIGASALTFGSIDTSTHGDKTLTVTYRGITVNHAVHVKGPVAISILSGSIPASVKLGETLDVSGLKVSVRYSDNFEELLDNSLLTVENIVTDTAGDKLFKVKYDGLEAERSVNVVGVKSMTVVTGTVVDKIIIGEAHTLANVKVNVTFTDDTTAVLGYADLSVTGAVDNTVANVYTVTFKHLDGTVAFPVNVYGVTGITVDAEDGATTLPAGEAPDLTKFKVYAVYGEGFKSVLLADGYTDNASSIDWNEEEDKTLTFTYQEFEKSVTISSTAPVLESIAITACPNVYVGKAFDKTLVVVTAYYGNNTQKTVAATIGDIDTATAGAATVTASFDGKTATKEINIIGVESIVVNGVPALVNVNESLDLTNLTVTVTYTNGDTEVITTGFEQSAFDTSSGGDKTFTVTYQGVSKGVNVHVKAVASISFVGGSFDSDIKLAHPISTVGTKIRVVYTNGSEEILNYVGNEDKITLSLPDTATAGTKTITATYSGATTTAEVYVLNVGFITMVVGSISNKVDVGTTLITENVQATVYYYKEFHTKKDPEGNDLIDENGNVVLDGFNPNICLTAIVGKEYLNIVSSVDTSKGGTDQAIVVTYVGMIPYNGGYYNSDAFVVAGGTLPVQTSQNVHVRQIADIFVHTAPTYVNKGSSIDNDEIKITVIYSNGEMEEGIGVNNGLTVGTIDTSSAGEKTLAVSYKDVSLNITITVIEQNEAGVIVGVDLPDSIIALKGYKENFRGNKNDTYKVGDDNPFKLTLTIIKLNEEGKIVEPTGGYTSKSSVYLVEGENKTLLEGANIATYVEINEARNTFDFTEAAIGKTFVIETASAEAPNIKKSHTVEVVDGYNVYDAKELNLLTNYDDTIDDDGAKTSQLEAVNRFLANNGIVRPEKLAGLVLHGNLVINTTDIPSEYIGSYTKDGVAKTGLYDQLSVYNHAADNDVKNFSIYGNYYTISSYNLPCVGENGYLDNGDTVSNSQLFMFTVRDSVFSGNASYKHTDYSTNVYNLALRDNDPNSNDQTASERHMRGLIAVKTQMHTINYVNSNIHAYFISFMTDSDHQTVNLTNVDFFNAWQNHLFTWANNKVPEAVHANIKVNVLANSRLAKCGGPVIISQTKVKDDDGNKLDRNNNSKTEIEFSDTAELYSYVTGQEAWFIAYGMTQLATQIMALDQPIVLTSQGLSQAIGQNLSSSFTTDMKIANVATMNLIMINMESGFSVGGSEDIDGKLTIAGDTVMNMDDGENLTVNMHPALNKAPLFQSSGADKVAYFDGSGLVGDGFDPAFYTGDYITLYYMGVAIVLEFYNPTNAP